MNSKSLKEAEKRFLNRYPGGFKHPEMEDMGKKHKMPQLVELAQTSLAKDKFNNVDFILTEVSKIISRSSMISMFEKPKFKNMTTSLRNKDKDAFVEGYFNILHGKEKNGFESLVEELHKRKMAKWTIATVVQAYYRPNKEVLIKPTTTKMIVKELDLDLDYHPTPSWEFYKKYRKIINDIKKDVNANLSPNNPAFCGFLMMSLQKF